MGVRHMTRRINLLVNIPRLEPIMLLVAALAVADTALAQPQQRRVPLPAGTSAIRGTLNDAESNQPVAGCTVRASIPPGTRSSVVTTGADGVYEFAGITDADYFLLVECPSHLWACTPNPDPKGPPCGPITLFKDQQQSNLDFRLTPAATVRGRVIDSSGKPVARATVRIGGPFLGNTLVRVQTGATRNDGSFEITGLPGGAWAFEVDVPPAAGTTRSPLVYYPGVLKRDEAGVVDVVAGKVTEGVTITVPAVLDRTLTVRIPPPDATMTEMNVSVIRAEPLMTRRLDIDAEGQAVIKGLGDGRYVVIGTARSGQEQWVDYQAVDFLEDSIDVALQLRPAGRVRGRIVGDRGVPPLGGATVGAAWVDNDVILNPVSPDEAAVAPDGSFEIEGLFGRRMLQLLRFDPAWRIHAVLQGRSDVTGSGIDIGASSTAEVTIVVRPR
jgi:hypothetical protein